MPEKCLSITLLCIQTHEECSNNPSRIDEENDTDESPVKTHVVSFQFPKNSLNFMWNCFYITNFLFQRYLPMASIVKYDIPNLNPYQLALIIQWPAMRLWI